MGSLEGNLNTAAFQEILEVLAQKNPAATWLISDGQDEKVVYFSTGGIRLYATDARRIARFEDYLLKRGLLTSEDLERALEAARDNRRESLDEVLERMGLLPRARFLEAIADLIYLELCDLVTWENSIYEFYEGNPPPEIFDQEHPALFSALDVKAMAGRVKEWCQEWALLKVKLHSERLRPRLAGRLDKIFEKKEVATQTLHFYRLIDGQRSLRDLSRASGWNFPEVARAVRDGLRDGHLKATLVAEKDPTTSEEVLDEIERLEEALDKAINTILIHKRIAGGYEKIGEKDRASEHYQAIGELHAGSGRIASALENFHRAINLSPQNISAHEVLIRRLQESGQEDRAMEEIVGLSRKLLSFGLAERALEGLRAIKSKALHLFDVRLLFAEILTTLGRGPEAIAEYLGMIREKKQGGAVEGIEDLYRKVLSLDPLNKEARAGLVRERRRNVAKGMVWVHRASGAAAALLMVGWLLSESVARVSWATAQAEVRRSAAGGGLKEALAKVREIASRHPACLLASSLLAVEEDLFRKYFYKLEEDLTRAAALLKEGKLGEAHGIWKAVAASKLVDSQVERARQGLRGLDAQKREGAELRRTAELYLDARLYEDAFAVCRKILERNTEGAEDLQVPFFIRSDPAGAEVKVSGVRWGTTPLWVIFPLGSLGDVVVEKPGYQAETVKGFPSRTSPVINVPLKKL